MGRVRLGIGIGLDLYFWTIMLIQDQQKMLIWEHVLLAKITMTREYMVNTMDWN